MTSVLVTKDADLSLEAVYNVAVLEAKVELGSADREGLVTVKPGSKGAGAAAPVLPEDAIAPVFQRKGDCDRKEVRASLVVLLNKLLRSGNAGTKLRPVVPLFLVELLNEDIEIEFTRGEDGDPDLVSIVRALYGRQADGVTKEELEDIQQSNAAALGKAALLVHRASYLPVLADAIAALSCEALKADTRELELFPERHAADVASALRTLLAGSSLVNPRKGATSGEFISCIPEAHGGLRESLKSASEVVAVRINWGCRSPTTLSVARSVGALSSDLRTLASNSEGRSAVGRDILAADFARFEAPFHNDATNGKSQYVPDEATRVTNRLAFEATTALAVLASVLGEKESEEIGVESNGSSLSKDLGQGGAQVIGEKKKKKGNQGPVTGKGTAFVRQGLTGILSKRLQLQPDIDAGDRLMEWAHCLEKFFRPEDRELQALLAEVKALVESNESRGVPKVAKGARDFGPKQMAVRDNAFSIITSVFKRHGAGAIDTPVFELRETLMGKYGEDSKLIYDLADQGGERLSLRYDLTVPFARYLATSGSSSMKRYQIAKVYRRDNPSKGRFREFYQCDFDIAGQYQSMVPDYEVLKILTELLDGLDIGDYVIKLNHRRLLDAMLDVSGVPASKFRSICSAIDKLDKLPWEQVQREMVEEKGLTAETADKLGLLVQKHGKPLDLLAELVQEGSVFLQHDGAKSALDELGLLFKYLSGQCLHRFLFDLSLARGLDYYTGVIFEAVFKGTVQVGSIAAGGRYDKLVGMFSPKDVPAVGMSLGIERVFAIMEEDKRKVVREKQTQVLVIAIGRDKVDVAIKIAEEFWDASIATEFVATAPAKIVNEFKRADTDGIPWVVSVGDAELQRKIVKLKDMQGKQEVEVARKDLVTTLRAKLQIS